MEHSLGLLKPDCLARNLHNWVFEKIKHHELELVLTKQFVFTSELVDAFYYQCKLRDYYEGLRKHLCSGPSMAYIVRGKNAISKLNSLTGFNDPSLAAVGTIRSRGKNIRLNLAHSSENFDQFFREMVVIFTKEEAMDLIKTR